MKRLTLEEIGKLAGVSRATVSRVINDYPFIRPEIRSKVQEIIDQTGFRPNSIARSLVSSRSNIVGLIIPSVVQKVFTDPYFASLIHGIAQGCNRNNLVLSVYLFHSLEEKHNVIQTIVGTGLVDGMIVTGDNRDTEILDVFLNSQIPLVMVGAPDLDNVSYVDTDNFGGAYTATKYLIDLGFRRIGIIATTINRSSEDRLQGYKQALLDHNIAVDEQLIAWGNYTVESGYQAMRDLLPHQPDAVFSSNDAMALGGMRALREANIRVPEDISIVGFDDLPHALQTEPALTTIQQTIQESGCEAVELLLKLLNDDGPLPLRTILPNTLIVRGTTRAVQS
jgi:LacI family transcriptional regulator